MLGSKIGSDSKDSPLTPRRFDGFHFELSFVVFSIDLSSPRPGNL